jgi:hypothetical protein
MSALVRRCLTLACLLAVWLVARPAAASSPFCDERGASALAPSPVLDVPNASIDLGERADACELDASHDVAYHRGERPHRAPSEARVDAMPAPQPDRVGPAIEAAPFPRESLREERSGVRPFLERPPRA